MQPLNLAYKQALIAYSKNEVPVGAVVVYDGKIIAKAHNLREQTQAFDGHAEILAMKKAAKKLGSWRLEGCSVYVTLEPCLMCAGAMIQARIDAVYYGALDPKQGAAQSITRLFNLKTNHQVKYQYIPDEKCANILTKFFKELRVK